MNEQSMQQALAAVINYQHVVEDPQLGPAMAQLLEKYGEIFSLLDPQQLVDLSNLLPKNIMAAALAAHFATDGAVKLSQAKRTFYLTSTDFYAQDLLLEAGYYFIHGTVMPRDNITYDFVCERALKTLEIYADKMVTTCCSAWMPHSVGKLEGDTTLGELWQNPVAAKARASMFDGKFKMCSNVLCPVIAHDGVNPPKTETLMAKRNFFSRVHPHGQAEPLPKGPHSLVFSYDLSCNLACPSCRPDRIIAHDAEREALDKLFAEKIEPVLPTLREVLITGSGDPFASRHFRNVLTRLAEPAYRHIKISLQTNGVLLDRRTWDEFDFDGRLHSIFVSADASNEETYASVRRYGQWPRLMENLKFLGEKRAAGAFQFLRLDNVVQFENYDQLDDIIAIGRTAGVDQVYFSSYISWGHISEETFRQNFCFTPDRPEFAVIHDVYQRHRNDADIDFGNVKTWFRVMQAAPAAAPVPQPLMA